MSVEATRYVIEQRGIPLATRAVLLVIADMVNRRGDAYPSITTIAEKCEITDRMVRKHLALASQLGVIDVHRSEGKRSVYTFPTPEQYDRGNNMTGVNNSSVTPEQYDTPHPYKNRKLTVNNVEQREPEEKKDFPEWFKTLLRITTKRGEEPVTEKLYEPLCEWIENKGHTIPNLENTALYIESAWTGQLKKRTNVRATFMNLVNREATNGFNARRVRETHSEENNIATRPQYAPSPLL